MPGSVGPSRGVWRPHPNAATQTAAAPPQGFSVGRLARRCQAFYPRGVRPQSRDTSADAEQVQIDLLRQAGSSRRLQMTFDLCDSTRAMSLRAIARANPQLSEREVKLRYVRLCYGPVLEELVRSQMSDER